jgi:UDP-galactopyranose mutase
MTSTEYSTDGSISTDYPVNDNKNNALYKKYKEINNPNVFFKGRLGQYQYFNMDQVIASALNFTKELI